MGIFLTSGHSLLFSLPQTASDVALDGRMDATARALMEAAAQNGEVTDPFEKSVPTGFLSGPGVSKAFAEIETLLPLLKSNIHRHVTKYLAPHETLRLYSDEGGHAVLTADLEKNRITPEEMFSLIERQMERIRMQYEKVKGGLTAEVCAEFVKEMEQIETRRRYWQEELAKLKNDWGGEREYHAKDIVIGERILLGRLLNLGVIVYSEPLASEGMEPLGLTSWIAPEVPLPNADETSPKKGDVVPALVNHDIGFGRRLKFRPHQILVLNRFRGLLRQSRDVATASSGELLRGTVVMPTGGGKTRLMMGAFAVAIEQNLYRLGDKFIVLNHTDRIHQQNREVVRLLSGYFYQKLGRPLKVSEYKAEEKDLSGDVVVVSIPSVNTEERREEFERRLRAALGSEGTLVLTAVDEIHHMEMGAGTSKESWRELDTLLRKISPGHYRLGFTATPTGKEGPYVARIRERDLMRMGVTPRTYLVKVRGVDLSQLKISRKAADFQTHQLVSVLLNHPDRNERLFDALDQHGLRRLAKSPSGKEQLEGTLGFAADLQHAAMMAKGYRDYFGRKGRNLDLIGMERGKIAKNELEEALGRYRRGESDGIVAVVSGETLVMDAVLEGVKQGEIEMVMNVDVLYEGSDLYMFSHLLGHRPTFSRPKKWQEKGRVNRRGPDDVTSDGRLQNDTPKILFDTVDDYRGLDRQLVFYGDLSGARGHTEVSSGRLFDLLGEKEAGEMDRGGENVRHESLECVLKEKIIVSKPSADTMDQPLVQKLWEVLESVYQNDPEMMALDLGISVEGMERLLKGEGWIDKRWFLRRLATLLYQPRESLVALINEERGLSDLRVSEDDIAFLRGALRVYEETGGEEADVAGFRTLRRVAAGSVSDQDWRTVWRGLLLYFRDCHSEPLRLRSGQAPAKNPEQTTGSFALLKMTLSKEWEAQLWDYFFEREKWGKEAKTAEEKLLLEARRGVALKFGGRLPVDLDGLPRQTQAMRLQRWLNGEKIAYCTKICRQSFYNQLRILLVSYLGFFKEDADRLISDAIFEQEGWPKTAQTAQEVLLLATRKRVALKFGGRLPERLNGLQSQTGEAPLIRWLKGKEIKFSQKLPSQHFYDQVRTLLVANLGFSNEKADYLISDAVFEREGWPKRVETAQEVLLLEARKKVALKFGGRLSLCLKDLPSQRKGAALTLWLKGKKMKFGGGLSHQSFYDQIRTFFVLHLGFSQEEANRLIVDAIFEEEGWPKRGETAQEVLLLETRKRVALKFGGRMPKNLEGISQHSPTSFLFRFIQGTADRLTDHNASQIRSLLVREFSCPPEYADRLIREARTQ